MKPDLIADVTLYPTEAGGKTKPALQGYGCPCMVSATSPGFDARLLLEDRPLHPGQTRRVGFAFLTPLGAETMRAAGRFYLWEIRIIGEATVIDDEHAA